MAEKKNPAALSEKIRIVRSDRRTVGFCVRSDGTVEVRAPKRMSRKDILLSLERNAARIERAVREMREQGERFASLPPFSEEELRAMAERAERLIPNRVDFYASRMGVVCRKITIRWLRSRWGSCSSAGNLSFNRLLGAAPQEALDSVVVHELCHLKEMNHSERFYREVYSVFPDYEKWRKWLKTEGEALLLRMAKTAREQG